MKGQASENIEMLTDEERRLYDRQIRLWGLDAQKRLNKFRVCISGMTGLGAEVAKNVILAGVARVDLVDHKIVTERDLKRQFMITPPHQGTNRATASLQYARRLNPMVQVNALEANILDKSNDYLTEFDLIVVCEMMSMQNVIELNERCRKFGVRLIVGHVMSGFGYFMSDLMVFEYVNEITIYGKVATKTKHNENVRHFPPLKDIQHANYVSSKQRSLTKRSSKLSLQFHLILEYFRTNADSDPTKDDLENLVPIVSSRINADKSLFCIECFDDTLFEGLSPIAAVVGGVLGQEVIKVASQNCEPVHNVFLFDGTNCTATSELFR